MALGCHPAFRTVIIFLTNFLRLSSIRISPASRLIDIFLPLMAFKLFGPLFQNLYDEFHKSHPLRLRAVSMLYIIHNRQFTPLHFLVGRSDGARRVKPLRY